MIRIFIASSTEALPIAESIQENLGLKVDVTIWNQGVSEPSAYLVEIFERAGQNFDYGIFVLTPDDTRIRGDDEHLVPRDNVLFELGVFVGALGRQKSFLVVPSGDTRLKLPSDLQGLVQARYNPSGRLPGALGVACTTIMRAIRSMEDRVDGRNGDQEHPPTAIAPEPGVHRTSREDLSVVHYAGRLLPNYTGQFLKGAKEEISVLGFSLRSFVGYFESRPALEVKNPIMEALARGALVRFLFLDPESQSAQLFAAERQEKRLLSDMKSSLERALEIRNELVTSVADAKLEVRTYSRTPVAHIKRVDGGLRLARLMCFNYLPGVQRPETPYFELKRQMNPLLYSAYSATLDEYIRGSNLIE